MNQEHIEELINLIYREYNWITEEVKELAERYGFKYFNSGQTKHVYKILNDPTKVLKISKKPKYDILNDEIKNVLCAPDLFPHVYDYDKKNKNPLWMICEMIPVISLTNPSINTMFLIISRLMWMN